MTTRRAFVHTAALAAAGAALPRAVRAAELKPLVIGYVPSTLFAPVFAAVDKGYLREAGYEANLIPIVAGQDSIVLAANGQIDVVAAALSAAFYNAVDRGFEVKFVASTGYQPPKGHPSALMIRQDLWDAGQRDIRAFKGKKIGWIGGKGAASSYYVATILRRAGLTLADVEGINIANPDIPAALSRKAIDATFVSAPYTSKLETDKLAHFVAAPKIGMSASGIFFGPKLLHDRTAAEAVLNACRRGAADIAGAGYYTPENLATFSKYSKLDIATLRTADRYDFKADLHIDEPTVEDMQAEFLREGVLNYKAPMNEVRLVARF
jgi:NitT/TauT family transport system substrate-binding protein